MEAWAVDNETSCEDIMHEAQQCTAICTKEMATIGAYNCSDGLMIGLSVCVDLDSATILHNVPIVAGSLQLELFTDISDFAIGMQTEQVHLVFATGLAKALNLTMTDVLQIGIAHPPNLRRLRDDIETSIVSLDYQMAVFNGTLLSFILRSANEISVPDSDAQWSFTNTVKELGGMNITMIEYLIYPRILYNSLAIDSSGAVLGSFGSINVGFWQSTTSSTTTSLEKSVLPLRSGDANDDLAEDSPYAAAIIVGIVAACFHTLCLAIAVWYFCRTVEKTNAPEQERKAGMSSRPGVRPLAAVRLASQRPTPQKKSKMPKVGHAAGSTVRSRPAPARVDLDVVAS